MGRRTCWIPALRGARMERHAGAGSDRRNRLYGGAVFHNGVIRARAHARSGEARSASQYLRWTAGDRRRKGDQGMKLFRVLVMAAAVLLVADKVSAQSPYVGASLFGDIVRSTHSETAGVRGAT